MHQDQDPAVTDGDHYSVIFENDKVRVLEYRDTPGTRTHEHHHGDSVMITLSRFTRMLTVNGTKVPVRKEPFEASWLPAQNHIGENVGETDTHVMFIELK